MNIIEDDGEGGFIVYTLNKALLSTASAVPVWSAETTERYQCNTFDPRTIILGNKNVNQLLTENKYKEGIKVDVVYNIKSMLRRLIKRIRVSNEKRI